MKQNKTGIIIVILAVLAIGAMAYGSRGSTMRGFNTPHGGSAQTDEIEVQQGKPGAETNDDNFEGSVETVQEVVDEELQQTMQQEKPKNLAPNFTRTSLDGERIVLSEYIGTTPVILDFFATWCHNCQRAMPKTTKLYEEFDGAVEVIGVNLQEREKTVQQFIESRNITFPIVLDPSGGVSRQYATRYTNTHILINKDGTINSVVTGDIDRSHFEKLLENSSTGL